MKAWFGRIWLSPKNTCFGGNIQWTVERDDPGDEDLWAQFCIAENGKHISINFSSSDKKEAKNKLEKVDNIIEELIKMRKIMEKDPRDK